MSVADVVSRRVDVGSCAYPLELGPGAVAQLPGRWREVAGGEAVLLVFDSGVGAFAERAAGLLEEEGARVVRCEVAAGEQSKCMAEVERICRSAASAGIRRQDSVVAIGGGVVGDLAGFVAASYQRGIRLIHVPTTLLAMVDSAIGGKTGVDIPEGKNYVGAIWQPELVVMDTDALATLPSRELACGFAEVVKYGLLSGPALVAEIEDWPALPGPAERVVALIDACVTQKADVVAGDERDLGRRAILNLGHTIGHGIEACGGYERYHHGEAISLGLLAALRLSERVLGLDPSWRERTKAVLARHGLPVTLDPDLGLDGILSAMGRDKKADGRALNMVLLSAPGEPHTQQDPDHADVVAAIEELRP